MTQKEAEAYAQRLRDVGWDASAGVSPLGHELQLGAADGGKRLVALSWRDAQILILGGAVARLP